MKHNKPILNEMLQERDATIERLEKTIEELEEAKQEPTEDSDPYKVMLHKVIDTIRSERLWTNPVRQVLGEAEALLK